MSLHHPADGRLRGTWLVLARVAWVAISGFAVVLFVASLASYFTWLHVPTTSSTGAPQLTPEDLHTLRGWGLSVDVYAWVDLSVYFLILLAYVCIGNVLFWRRADDRMALLASFSLMTFPVAFATPLVGTLPLAWTLPTEIVEMLGNCGLGLFFLVFPSGRFVPRWASLLMVIWTFYWGVSIFFPLSPLANSIPFIFPLPGAVLCMIALHIYRYLHVSTPLERQQTKWVIAGFAFAFGPLVILLTLDFLLLAPAFPTNSLLVTAVQWPCDLLTLLCPLSFAFAILRHRLWDIDALINRTLVYTLLTGLLVVIYLGLTIGLESLFSLLTHQTSQPVSIVVSTLAITALFRPLRARLQASIDRRFYRRKYDAAQIVASFSATLHSETDLGHLSERLMNVVQETMQPMALSLWICTSVPKPARDKREETHT